MQLPNRNEWMRMGYTVLGGGGALIWNRYLPIAAQGGGYIPPAALAMIVLLSENTGETEKDIAAGILGYTAAAQAISFATTAKAPATDDTSNPSSGPQGLVENPLDVEAAKLQKIRAVTGTLGALADIVGKFRGV